MEGNGAAVLAIYRQRNARTLARLIRDVPLAWTVSLWALDGVSPILAEHTLGEGPGTKFELLNRLYDMRRPPPGAAVVVTDDDVRFRRGGSLARFVDLVNAAGFSLAMPAHGARSPHSFAITRQVPRSRARLTTFVEIGPMFVVAAHARTAVLPFPADIGMGWGLELAWHDLVARGHLLGVVDEVPIRHLGPVAAAYDDSAERRRLRALFEARGIASWEPVQQTLGLWPAGRGRAPWLESEEAGS